MKKWSLACMHADMYEYAYQKHDRADSMDRHPELTAEQLRYPRKQIPGYSEGTDQHDDSRYRENYIHCKTRLALRTEFSASYASEYRFVVFPVDCDMYDESRQKHDTKEFVQKSSGQRVVHKHCQQHQQHSVQYEFLS